MVKIYIFKKKTVDKVWIVESRPLSTISVVIGEDLWRNVLNCERHTNKPNHVAKSDQE